jgi:hypothetical protein
MRGKAQLSLGGTAVPLHASQVRRVREALCSSAQGSDRKAQGDREIGLITRNNAQTTASLRVLYLEAIVETERSFFAVRFWRPIGKIVSERCNDANGAPARISSTRSLPCTNRSLTMLDHKGLFWLTLYV